VTSRSARFNEAMAAYNRGDAELAVRLMEECARTNDPVACYLLALWYRTGDDIPADLSKSDAWLSRLEELAEQGNVEAQWELAGMYRFADLLPLEIERANCWLERAADGGFAEAQHHLAWYFETGQYDYPVDPEAAAEWYQRAFDQEHPETLYVFAMKEFKDGQLTEEAFRLLRKAADKGFVQAAHILRSYAH
jgi:uncharacterized protein